MFGRRDRKLHTSKKKKNDQEKKIGTIQRKIKARVASRDIMGKLFYHIILVYEVN